MLEVPNFERSLSMSECFPWAILLRSARMCVSTILSILWNLFKALAQMDGKESKDSLRTLHVAIPSQIVDIPSLIHSQRQYYFEFT
jgi:hypothetical protein